MRATRCRFKKENHINIIVEGKDGEEIAREIKAVLHGTKHRRNTSYNIILLEDISDEVHQI